MSLSPSFQRSRIEYKLIFRRTDFISPEFFLRGNKRREKSLFIETVRRIYETFAVSYVQIWKCDALEVGTSCILRDSTRCEKAPTVGKPDVPTAFLPYHNLLTSR